MRKCLIRGCNNSVQGRGLCKKHYNDALALVRRKETTWKELEELGLAISVKTNDFKAILIKARKDGKQTHKKPEKRS